MGEGVRVGVGVVDLPGLVEVEDRVVALERQTRALHADRLRTVLALHRRHVTGGVALMTPSVWALHTDSGEHAARALLEEALLLDALPEGVDAVADGLLGVAHCRAVAELLGPLDPGPRVRVWELLLPRLRADVEQARPRPPARLRELLHRLVRRVDAEGVEERRRQARAAAGVSLRRRDDGLADLFATGLTALDAQAVDARLDRLAQRGDPAVELGRRKVDLLRDLVLGRVRYGPPDDEVPQEGSRCGCLPGDAPCGVEVQVLVPLGTVLRQSEQPAELVGAGLLSDSDLRAVLSAAPTLRAVWVDDGGLPVAVSEGVVRTGRGAHRVADALPRLLDRPPGGGDPRRAALHPRHPDDHGPDGRSLLGRRPTPPQDGGAWEAEPPWLSAPPWLSEPPWLDEDDPAAPHLDPGAHPDPPLPEDPVLHDASYWRAFEESLGLVAGPALRQHPHPVGTPGPYAPSADLRRLLAARSPRCEWPGCGARTARCDADHDVPWPDGPTCACNLGPLCRRHHRAKQLGWVKERLRDGGVRWTGPTGRTWTSPPQHGPPEQQARQEQG